jgi:hypothetical protein
MDQIRAAWWWFGRAEVLPLDATAALADYFAGVLTARSALVAA